MLGRPRLYRIILIPMSAALGLALALWFRDQIPAEEHFRQGLSALERGDMEMLGAAIEALQHAPEFQPHVRVLRGGRMLREGNPSGALQLLFAHRPEGEIRAPALLLAVECFYRQGQLAEAEAVVRQLIQEQPRSANAHRWLAVIHYDLGATNAAIKELAFVMTLVPDDYRPRHLLGVIYSDFEKYAEAAKHYRKALECDPPSPQRQEIIRNLAQALVKVRQYDEALEVLRGVPEDAVLLALESECHWGLARLDRARQSLERARKLDAVERLVLLLTARIELETGNPAAAIAALKRHLERDPHDFEGRYRLALAYRQLGRLKEYEIEIARMQQSQRLRRQLSELSDLAVDRPRDADIRDQIAAVCETLGKDKLAAVYRRAANSCRRAAGLKSSHEDFGGN